MAHFACCICGLFDGLGSIVAMTNSSGTEVNSYDYDPYGQNINQVEQAGLNNPWKFAGGYLDSTTSLYKFGTRYYDSSLGRWTQQDPVGGSLGDLNAANRYVYANDDPVNEVDPSGKDAVSCTAAIIGAISGGFIASWGLAPLIFAAWAAGPVGILAAVILFLAGVGFNWSLIVAAVYSFCQ